MLFYFTIIITKSSTNMHTKNKKKYLQKKKLIFYIHIFLYYNSSYTRGIKCDA